MLELLHDNTARDKWVAIPAPTKRKIERLYQRGYSIDVIEEITGVYRHKIQYFLGIPILPPPLRMVDKERQTLLTGAYECLDEIEEPDSMGTLSHIYYNFCDLEEITMESLTKRRA